MATLTYEVPDELLSEVESISDLDKRIERFVREQAALEQWRRSRYSTAAKELAEEALESGAKIRESENADDIRERLLKRWDQIAATIDA